MWHNYRDKKGVAAKEPRADYKRFFDEVYILMIFPASMPRAPK